jgi:hypothetical protein
MEDVAPLLWCAAQCFAPSDPHASWLTCLSLDRTGVLDFIPIMTYAYDYAPQSVFVRRPRTQASEAHPARPLRSR